MALAWQKTGCFFRVDGEHPWMTTHAQCPVPHLLGDGRLRVYFTTRDAHNRCRPTYVDVAADDPSSVIAAAGRPLLELGRPGTFDDCGMMTACLIGEGETLHLLYLGWTRAFPTPYRTALGLAVSTDGGETFERVQESPVLDRSAHDPFMTLTAHVLRDGPVWRMWYSSTIRWIRTDEGYDPVYVIKRATATDPITWEATGDVCIDVQPDDEAVGRPWVLRDGDRLRMWYSRRAAAGFRDDPERSYRIGYAESSDGRSWERRDEDAGIDVSDSGWDSEMIAYAAVYEHAGALHMLYNGNGFGRSGIGHAVASG